MYQCYFASPGRAKLNHVKHGDRVEVCVGVDQAYHSSVNAVIWSTDSPPPPKEENDVYGFYCPDTKYMTFKCKKQIHVKDNFDYGKHVPIFPIVFVVKDGEDAVVFEGTKAKLSYHSRGDE